MCGRTCAKMEIQSIGIQTPDFPHRTAAFYRFGNCVLWVGEEHVFRAVGWEQHVRGCSDARLLLALCLPCVCLPACEFWRVLGCSTFARYLHRVCMCVCVCVWEGVVVYDYCSGPIPFLYVCVFVSVWVYDRCSVCELCMYVYLCVWRGVVYDPVYVYDTVYGWVFVCMRVCGGGMTLALYLHCVCMWVCVCVWGGGGCV